MPLYGNHERMPTRNVQFIRRLRLSVIFRKHACIVATVAGEVPLRRGPNGPATIPPPAPLARMVPIGWQRAGIFYDDLSEPAVTYRQIFCPCVVHLGARPTGSRASWSIPRRWSSLGKPAFPAARFP